MMTHQCCCGSKTGLGARLWSSTLAWPRTKATYTSLRGWYLEFSTMTPQNQSWKTNVESWNDEWKHGEYLVEHNLWYGNSINLTARNCSFFAIHPRIVLYRKEKKSRNEGRRSKMHWHRFVHSWTTIIYLNASPSVCPRFWSLFSLSGRQPKDSQV